MALRINFNAEATVTHTALLRNERAMNKSLLRISTGNRILSAADDAAGLFIADQLNVVAAALEQGNRNIQTGISALQIAETNVGQIFEKLQQIYTKAQSAANDINDPNARAALQRDITNLIDAIQKIASDTEYNGIKLLDGTFQNKVIHYGARANQTISVNIGNVKPDVLGGFLATGSGAVVSGTAGTAGGSLAALLGTGGSLASATGVILNGTGEYLQVQGYDVVRGTSTASLIDAATVARNINNGTTFQDLGIEAVASNQSTANLYITSGPNSVVTYTGSATDSSATVNLRFYIGDGATTFTINNFASATGTGAPTVMSLDNLVQQINVQSAQVQAGITASNDNGKLKITTANGETIAVEAQVTGLTSATVNINLGQILQGSTTSGNITTNNSYFAAAKVGKVNIIGSNIFTLNYSGVEGFNFNVSNGGNAVTRNLNSLSVLDNAGAEEALMVLKKAIQKVDTIRTQIGSVINNLQAIWDGQKASYDNTKEAENVIRNTDFAAEMSTFVTMQIRMQSGVAMLAQANSLPQLVLQLLR